MSELRDEKLLKKIGLKLKALREHSHISQKQFYHDTNIHIGRIEAGKQNISVTTLSQLCKHFDLSLEEFFGSINA